MEDICADLNRPDQAREILVLRLRADAHVVEEAVSSRYVFATRLEAAEAARDVIQALIDGAARSVRKRIAEITHYRKLSSRESAFGEPGASVSSTETP